MAAEDGAVTTYQVKFTLVVGDRTPGEPMPMRRVQERILDTLDFELPSWMKANDISFKEIPAK